MGAVTVDEVFTTPLNRIKVVGGDVLHALKRSDLGYVDFGEVYFSIVEEGAIKAWKKHRRMTLNIVVPVGSVLFTVLDDQGRIREEELGENRYVRLTVPPGIWFGFKGLFSPHSILMNIADLPHDATEVERRSIYDLNYDWDTK